MIESAGLSDRATKLSLAIFAKIAAAESKIHNIPLDRVHFHEVGAVDSIVDIVGVALAIDNLSPDAILCSPVPLGSGKIRIDHGIYPVPAPATLEMMRGLPVAPSPYAMELTTPTGAGIVAALVSEFSPSLPPMVVEAIGYGAGTRELPNQPNVLRSVLGVAEKQLGLWPSAVRAEQLGMNDHLEHERHHREQ
jgi:pyridinium-3,5-bisthiocarboxylic acid mononucleotide nickel chelatase